MTIHTSVGAGSLITTIASLNVAVMAKSQIKSVTQISDLLEMDLNHVLKYQIPIFLQIPKL